jgi:hypothetical protein
MKKILFKKFILLILFTLVNVYFMVFNWQIFTINQNVNLGFGMVRLPPFIILFLLGFLIIGILSWVSYITNLQRTIYELEQGVELGKMKDKLVQNKIREQLMDQKNIDVLQNKLGIPDLMKKQDELHRLLSEMITKIEGEDGPAG